MLMGSNRLVEVVDGLPELRDTTSSALRSEGFDVVAVNDYHAAVATLTARVPNLVCVDLRLPRESGFDLCDYVRGDSRLMWVPILVTSERASPQDMAYAEHVGANAFLKKPFTRESLLKYVTAILDGPQASRPSIRRLRRSERPPS
jgi:twitching motility two-component system response regulator PilG